MVPLDVGKVNKPSYLVTTGEHLQHRDLQWGLRCVQTPRRLGMVLYARLPSDTTSEVGLSTVSKTSREYESQEGAEARYRQ